MAINLLTEIYSSFEPFQPPVKEAYVQCEDVRGGWEVVRELGRNNHSIEAADLSALFWTPGRGEIYRAPPVARIFSERKIFCGLLCGG